MPRAKRFDEAEVLERAMAAFWTRGYEATSVAELVAATGINRGSLYDTFGDKRALFLAALRSFGNRHRRRLAEAAATLPPLAALRAPFAALTADAGRPGRGCFLTNTALERAPHDEEARAIVAEAQEATEAFFARTLAAGQRRGDIRADLAPETAARGLLAALLGTAVLARSRPEPELLRAAVDGALAGVVRRDAPPVRSPRRA